MNENTNEFVVLLQAKVACEAEIAAALKKFTEATQHRVSSVSISTLGNTWEEIKDYTEYKVDCEVRVAL